MAFCGKCGGQVADGLSFCTHCGQAISAAAPAVQAPAPPAPAPAVQTPVAPAAVPSTPAATAQAPMTAGQPAASAGAAFASIAALISKHRRTLPLYATAVCWLCLFTLTSATLTVMNGAMTSTYTMWRSLGTDLHDVSVGGKHHGYASVFLIAFLVAPFAALVVRQRFARFFYFGPIAAFVVWYFGVNSEVDALNAAVGSSNSGSGASFIWSFSFGAYLILFASLVAAAGFFTSAAAQLPPTVHVPASAAPPVAYVPPPSPPVAYVPPPPPPAPVAVSAPVSAAPTPPPVVPPPPPPAAAAAAVVEPRFCPNCGKPRVAGAKFCAGCGAAFAT